MKTTSFNVWVVGNLWNSTQNILPIHWKNRFLYNNLLRALRFKSSYAFLKCPPDLLGERVLFPEHSKWPSHPYWTVEAVHLSWAPCITSSICSYDHRPLKHWGRNKMAAILQTSFSIAFPWTKTFEFWMICHWNVFLRVSLTIWQHWFR